MEFTREQILLAGRKLAELAMSETAISKPFNDELDRIWVNRDTVGAEKLIEVLSDISQVKFDELLKKRHTHRPFDNIRVFTRDFIRYVKEKQ